MTVLCFEWGPPAEVHWRKWSRFWGALTHARIVWYAAAPLEGFAPDEWVCFERALVVRDIFTGGTRTWLSPEDAQTFRRDIYKIYGTSAVAGPQPQTRV